jgi:hypothetical protein
MDIHSERDVYREIGVLLKKYWKIIWEFHQDNLNWKFGD